MLFPVPEPRGCICPDMSMHQANLEKSQRPEPGLGYSHRTYRTASVRRSSREATQPALLAESKECAFYLFLGTLLPSS